jgi:hypothetical protein
MHRTVGIGQARADHVEPVPLGGLDRDLQIAHVVERIIGRVIAHAVGGEPLGRQFHHIVGEKLEGEQALATGVDDQRRLRHPLLRMRIRSQGSSRR